MTPYTAQVAAGTRYLDFASRLARRMRLADPLAGVWEAADFQWWWRAARASDRHGQLFWLDDDGEPMAAVILTAWSDDRWQCDMLRVPGLWVEVVELWASAAERLAEIDTETIELPVPDDEPQLVELALRDGFTADDDDLGVSCWLDARARPKIAALEEGFTLHSRAETPDAIHPLVNRNGPDVVDRLAQCSIYDPKLDLMVMAPNGELAGYGLFWADPVTGVGLVEPMRTEEPFERRGIAHHVLSTGLDLLATRGCTRLKVASDGGLYTSVGFRVATRNLILYRRAG